MSCIVGNSFSEIFQKLQELLSVFLSGAILFVTFSGRPFFECFSGFFRKLFVFYETHQVHMHSALSERSFFPGAYFWRHFSSSVFPGTSSGRSFSGSFIDIYVKKGY